MPEVVFACFTVAGGVGGLAFATLVARPEWAVRQLSKSGDFPVKVAIESLQAVSGLTGIGMTFLKADGRDKWFPVALASFGSFTVWKLVQLAVDWRQKGETARAVATSEMLSRLVVGVHNGVMRKLGQVLNAITRPGRPQTSIVQVREALTPTRHINELLEQLATVIQREARDVNVRVGVYVDRGGDMVPVYGVNLQNLGYNPFGSYKTHPAFYRLAEREGTSHVARCVREKRTILVPDCATASLAGEFQFAHAAQREYLQSLVVYPLGEVYPGGNPAQAVIAVDSNRAGFFRLADFGLIESVLKEFGLRVRLEMALHTLLEKRGDN